MSKVRVASFSVSLDGFGAGLDQSVDNPIGIRGLELHTWMFETRMFHEMTGETGGETSVDNDFAERMFQNVGAVIMGRNMFAPIRGPWGDDAWKGWWGDNPPYHVPVFVLTHFARPPIIMEGGTTFNFVTDGIESALRQAKHAAGSADVNISGGASTIRQYLTANLIDEMHLAFSPAFLGQGEHLFSGIDLSSLGFSSVRAVAGERATHVLLTRE